MLLRKKLPPALAKRIRAYPLFYQKVWRACFKIPPGETRSYRWVAKKVGNPNAARAVGNALAANPCAPRIPCHRVIRSDGRLGGYSGPGSTARKHQLLLREKRSNER